MEPGRPSSSPWAALGSRIDELEAENIALREQLELSRVQPTRDPTYKPASVEEYGPLATAYNNLAEKYRELEYRHDKCQPYIDRATRKYNEAKKNAGQWKAYYEKIKAAKRSGLEDARKRPTEAAGAPNHVATEEAHGEAEELTPRPARPGCERQHRSLPPIAEASKPQLSSVSTEPCVHRSSSHPTHVTSSQTTDPGSDPAHQGPPLPGQQAPSSDDDAVLVSTRSLKRKRGAHTRTIPQAVRIKQEPNSPEMPIEIKSEDYSSPVRHRLHIARQQTSDLNAIGEVYDTPRRHRVQFRAVSEEVRKLPRLPTGISSLSDGAEPEQEQAVAPQQSQHPVLKASRIAHTHNEKNALRPLSVNVAAQRTPVGRRRRRDEDAVAKAALLSEDGDVAEEQSQHLATEGQNATKTIAGRRLTSMLDVPASPFQPLAKDHTPQSVSSMPKGQLTPASNRRPTSKQSKHISPKKPVLTPVSEARPILVASNKRSPAKQGASSSRVVRTPLGAPKQFIKSESPNKKPTGQKSGTSATNDLNLEDSPPPVRPEDEPLRNRPLSALRPEDCKVNPKYMGTDFAFADTLRGRDQRRCLQGCTNPDCCGGALRQAAEAAGNVGQSDAEVLEDFLGGNWQEIMGAYTRDQRGDLLKQARASSFARQYGKHKQAYERRTTPPGFWETGMPTTQEEAAFRAESEEIRRKKAEFRWREAMREGDGMWLFRDE